MTDEILAALAAAAQPLKAADVVKKLPKRPRKTPAAEHLAAIDAALADLVRQGRAFAHPSGKSGLTRYWSRDERLDIRGRALTLAIKPMTPAALARAMKGADPKFAETCVRGLIADGLLHPHPPARKGGAELYGTTPHVPPPPLELPAHAKEVAKLAAACLKLLGKAGVPAQTLLDALAARLATPIPPPAPAVAPAPPLPTPDGPDMLILEQLRGVPVAALADLRRSMPESWRGPAFDAAVLRLDALSKVILFADADPAALDGPAREGLVQDGGVIFTTISLRG